MPSTLIIGYGGFGAGCVREFSRTFSWPAAVLDTHEVERHEGETYLDLVEISGDEQLDFGRLRNIMDGYRNILLVSSLGGESFGTAYNAIINSARLLELPVVSLCTIPYIFESERRSRALENLDMLSDSASNLFIIDSQKTIKEDCAPSEFLERTKSFLVDSIRLLTDLLEYGPFCTYCSDPIYTFGVGNAPIVSEAVRDALDNLLFDQKSVTGKVLLCSGFETDSTEIDEITKYLVQRCGALPEFIGKSNKGNQNLILFVPISCHQHE